MSTQSGNALEAGNSENVGYEFLFVFKGVTASLYETGKGLKRETFILRLDNAHITLKHSYDVGLFLADVEEMELRYWITHHP